MLASKRARIAQGLVIAGALALLVACSDGAIPSGRTGVDVIDTVLDAVEANDADAIVPLIKIEDTPCLRGLPAEATPVCLDDEETGTLVPTITFGSCIGIGQERATAAGVAAEIVDRALTLHAVHEAPDGNLFEATYSLIFNRPDAPGSQTPGLQRGYAILLSEEQLVATDVNCGVPAAELIEFRGLGDLIPLAD